MSRLAIVRRGILPHVVETFIRGDTDPGWPAPDGCEIVTEQALSPGWRLAGEAGLPPVPASVTRWQARRWLVDHGYDLDAIESQFATIADPLARARALVDWRDAPVYERTHPLVAWVGEMHGLDAAGLDQAFREMAGVS